MHFELDHVFIARDGCDVVEATLASLGLRFGASRTHPGQGTANVRAFFSNAYLELLFPRKDVPLDIDVVSPLGLQARFSSASSASPVGLAYRAPSTHQDPREWPFETWPYSAPYLPRGTQMHIVTPRDAIDEPLVFILPYKKSALQSARGPATDVGDQTADQWSGRRLARVGVERPTQLPSPSAPISWFVRNGAFDLKPAERGHWLTLEFEPSQGRRFEGHEAAPISVHW
jgi:hypothetical protein